MTRVTPQAGATVKTRPGRFWFEAGLVLLVFLVFGADPAPDVNEAHYLCRLKHFWAPGDYCPGDLFLESPDAHFTVVWLFGWVTRIVPLEATAWIGRLLSWALLAAGWTRLVRRVTPTPLLAPLAAVGLAAATEQLHLAGEWFLGGFEAKTLAYGLVFLALADAIDGRWNRAWAGLGVASALHALVGAWSVVALGAAAAVGPRPPVRTMLPGLVAGGLLSLAGVVPALLLDRDTPAEVVEQAHQIYVYYRLPHHLALLTMPSDWLANRAARHAALVAGLAGLTAWRWRAGGNAVRVLLLFAWAAEAQSALGLAISLIGWEDRSWAASWLRYYWHRLADVAVPIAVAAALAQWLGALLERRRVAGLVAALVATTLAAVYLADTTIDRGPAPVAGGDAVMADPAAWTEMLAWVRENAAEDALFLVPRRSHTFKWHTGRAEVVTRKDIPQNAAGLVEWRRRMADVFEVGEGADGKPRLTPSLAALGAERLRELAAEYGADYALDQAPRRELATPLRRRASLPIVHRVGPYTLYDLRDGR